MIFLLFVCLSFSMFSGRNSALEVSMFSIFRFSRVSKLARKIFRFQIVVVEE